MTAGTAGQGTAPAETSGSASIRCASPDTPNRSDLTSRPHSDDKTSRPAEKPSRVNAPRPGGTERTPRSNHRGLSSLRLGAARASWREVVGPLNRLQGWAEQQFLRTCYHGSQECDSA